jgi:hypothetical protein
MGRLELRRQSTFSGAMLSFTVGKKRGGLAVLGAE